MNNTAITKEKIKEIIDYINSLFKERDELAKILVLAILSKQHVFLVGEAGVGKTGIVKEIIDLFKDAKFFKTLVTHDTQEEDLFGNIKDRDKRLQSIINSNFVFLDEVYKGSPKLLNSCLELMNERIYSNGFETIDIPLYSLFAASNEYPRDSFLAPFDDRLTFRYKVERIKEEKNFLDYIDTAFQNEKQEKHKIEGFNLESIEKLNKLANNVEIDEFYKRFIRILKESLILNKISLSDRKIFFALKIMKISAIANGRNKIDASDIYTMKNIAWADDIQKQICNDVFYDHFFHSKQSALNRLKELEMLYNDYIGYITVTFNNTINFKKEFKTTATTKAEVFFNAEKENIVTLINVFHYIIKNAKNILEDKKYVDFIQKLIRDNIFCQNDKSYTYHEKIIEKTTNLYQNSLKVFKKIEIFQEITYEKYINKLESDKLGEY